MTKKSEVIVSTEGEKALLEALLGILKCECEPMSSVIIVPGRDVKKGAKRPDFIMASSKGLFVIESKYWRGQTYIEACNSNCPVSHSLKHLKNFDIKEYLNDCMTNVKITNIQNRKEDSEYQLRFVGDSPLWQVKTYSMALIEKYKEYKGQEGLYFNSILVFHSAPNCGYKIYFDDKLLSGFRKLSKEDTSYTVGVVTQADFVNFHKNLPCKNLPIDIKNLEIAVNKMTKTEAMVLNKADVEVDILIDQPVKG